MLPRMLPHPRQSTVASTISTIVLVLAIVLSGTWSPAVIGSDVANEQDGSAFNQPTAGVEQSVASEEPAAPPPPPPTPTATPTQVPTQIPPTQAPPTPPPAIPTAAPTEVPPTEVPPTLAPSPTAIEEIVLTQTSTPTNIPTELSSATATETATFAPTETESFTPTPTETETPTPTETETPTATPTATQTPIPFDPALSCQPSEADQIAVAGEADWAWLECEVGWNTENVQSVQVRVWTDEAGWSVIAAEGRANSGDVSSDADQTSLTLTDGGSGEADFLSGRFFLGSRLGCLSPTSAQINVELTATSAGASPDVQDGAPPARVPSEDAEESDDARVDARIETSVKAITAIGQPPTAPAISITSISLDPVDNSLPFPQVTTGSISFEFENAPSACGWKATVTFFDFVSGDRVIPASNVRATSMRGNGGLSLTATENGTIELVQPPGDPMAAASGSITIATELVLDSYLPQGAYQARVAMQSESLS